MKKVIGFELYQVSNLGNVKNVKKERLLKQTLHSKGYLMVNLSNKGKTKTHQVHQLVAIAFLGHKPCGLTLVVNHINFNRLNNNVKNLEIVTNRENTNRKHLPSSSKYTGAYFIKKTGKWLSRICINGKGTHIGLFKTELEASEAYQKELKKI